MGTAKQGDTVLIGLSGGVDSAVSAALLKKQGYIVTGISFKFWNYNRKSINSKQYNQDDINLKNASKVAQKLGINHIEKDASQEFYNKVIIPFIQTYGQARTPNPCVWCNPEVKWKNLLEEAEKLDIEFVSTGHYAKTSYDSRNHEFKLLRGKDKKKDQSYFLYRLRQEYLRKTIFPLGNYTKREVVETAEEMALPIRSSRESQDLCFLPGKNLNEFLKENLPDDLFEKGNIITRNNKIIGEHNGLVRYTIGQRKKLGVSVGKPVYVIELQKDENNIVLGEREFLYSENTQIQSCNWISNKIPVKSFSAEVQIRYNHKPAKALIEPLDKNRCNIVFKIPQPAVTPGQSAVIYNQDEVLGGGIIVKGRSN